MPRPLVALSATSAPPAGPGHPTRVRVNDAYVRALQAAGFTHVQVHTEQLGDFIRTADERWTDIQAGPEGKPLLALDPAQQEQVRADHLAELAALATPQGIWVDVPVNFAFAQS